jgi:hypothetical protein
MIRMPNSHSQRRTLRYHICMVLYVDFLVIFGFAASFAASLWISILGLAYGTIQTLVPRPQNAKYFKSEDYWTFGQIVPLILLIQPIGAMLELYRSRENSEEDLGVAIIDTELHGLEAITAPAMEDTTTHEGQAVEFSSKGSPCPVVTLQSDEQDTTEPATDFRTIIFASRIFRVLITMTHISLTVFSGLIFALNAKTIGYSSAYNYLWILYALALHVIMLLITTGIAIPFSSVFRSDLECYDQVAGLYMIGVKNHLFRSIELCSDFVPFMDIILLNQLCSRRICHLPRARKIDPLSWLSPAFCHSIMVSICEEEITTNH